MPKGLPTRPAQTHASTSADTQLEALLSAAEAARALGVTTQTLGTWRRRGLLVGVRTPGGHFRYRERDIQEIRDRRHQPREV